MQEVHVMEKNANDKLIWVDLFDNEIGSGDKLETHVKNQLHRAFSPFIVHDGKMLIQKRALEKYHSGGLWANACCSHPRWGESLLDAVQKRMEEELGIPQGSCEPKELFAFNYFTNCILRASFTLLFVLPPCRNKMLGKKQEECREKEESVYGLLPNEYLT